MDPLSTAVFSFILQDYLKTLLATVLKLGKKKKKKEYIWFSQRLKSFWGIPGKKRRRKKKIKKKILIWGLGKLLSPFCEPAAAVGTFSLLKTWFKFSNNHGNHTWIHTLVLACNHPNWRPAAALTRPCSRVQQPRDLPPGLLMAVPPQQGAGSQSAHSRGISSTAPWQITEQSRNGLLVFPVFHLHMAPFTLYTERVWAVPYRPKRLCGTTYMSICIRIWLGGMPNQYSCSQKTPPFYPPLLQPGEVCPRNLLLLPHRQHCSLLLLWHQAEAPMEGVCPSLKLVAPVSPHLIYCKDLLSGSWKMKVWDIPGQQVQHFRSAG